MKDNLKNKVVTIGFMIIISIFMLSNIIIPDAAFSYSERRKLTDAPKHSFEKLFSGDVFDEYEKYFLDQFVLRDTFRTIKALGTYYLFNQKDNNKIYVKDGNIIKMEYPLNEKSVLNTAKKLNEIYEQYLRGMDVNYAIIPDKNYFMAAQNGNLSMDYDRMLEIMHENVSNMKYIDLFDSLSIDDYYRTDIHWNQSKITKIANKLMIEMGNKAQTENNGYIRKELYPFYGSYYGQAALNVNPDTLVYLTDETLEKAMVYDYELKLYNKIYMPEKFGGIDSYDVFLSGAKPLLTIENTDSTLEKELILFRDSFGSSIAPLLLKGYSKITLIDLRYITTDYLEEFIDFTHQDVLFMYNTHIVNNSYMLK